MIDIIRLINSLFSNNFQDFFGILNCHLYYDLIDIDIINLIEDIKWYYMFNDIINTKKEGIRLIKLIYNY